MKGVMPASFEAAGTSRWILVSLPSMGHREQAFIVENSVVGH
jgi:hypothetical protein